LRNTDRYLSWLFVSLLLAAGIWKLYDFMESSKEAAQPLRLQFSIRLPDSISSTGFKLKNFPEAMQWSPDGRTLAILGSGKLFLFDLEQKQIVDRDIEVKGGPQNIAWSADGSLLALGKINVRLFRVADGKELGRRDGIRYARCGTSPRQGAAFTADGRFLWVGCGARGERGGYRAAEKLTVPDLELADSVDVEATAPDYLSYTNYERIAVEDGRLRLSSILLSCQKEPNISEYRSDRRIA
jgi:hypothetical protein